MGQSPMWNVLSNTESVSEFDSKGDWVAAATQGGVIRYNTVTQLGEVFNAQDYKMKYNFTYSTSVGKNGELLVVTLEGVGYFKNNQWNRLYFSNASYRAVKIDFNDELWILTDVGLYHFNNNNWTFQSNLNGIGITGLYRMALDEDNTLYIYSDTRIVKYSNGVASLVPLPSNRLITKIFCKNGSIFMANNDNSGISPTNHPSYSKFENGIWIDLYSPTNLGNNEITIDLCVDSNENVYTVVQHHFPSNLNLQPVSGIYKHDTIWTNSSPPYYFPNRIHFQNGVLYTSLGASPISAWGSSGRGVAKYDTAWSITQLGVDRIPIVNSYNSFVDTTHILCSVRPEKIIRYNHNHLLSIDTNTSTCFNEIFYSNINNEYATFCYKDFSGNVWASMVDSLGDGRLSRVSDCMQYTYTLTNGYSFLENNLGTATLYYVDNSHKITRFTGSAFLTTSIQTPPNYLHYNQYIYIDSVGNYIYPVIDNGQICLAQLDAATGVQTTVINSTLPYDNYMRFTTDINGAMCLTAYKVGTTKKTLARWAGGAWDTIPIPASKNLGNSLLFDDLNNPWISLEGLGITTLDSGIWKTYIAIDEVEGFGQWWAQKRPDGKFWFTTDNQQSVIVEFDPNGLDKINDPNTVSGVAYLDTNNNSTFDFGEPTLTNQIVYSGTSLSTTNEAGQYLIETGSGSQHVKITTRDYLQPTTPNHFINMSTPSGNNVTGKNFGCRYLPNVKDLEVDITATALRPGMPATYWINFKNSGTEICNSGTIVFQIDSTMNNVIIPDDVIDLGHNFYRYNFLNLSQQESRSLCFGFTVPVDKVLGDKILAHAEIEPFIHDTTDFNNFKTLTSIITGSYDPNDKSVDKTMITDWNNDLVYTVRFQNTGTDTAFKVTIIDTLDEDIEINSFKFIASSHDCNVFIQDNILNFTYNNILLPDSNTNEILSHGFVKFSFKARSTTLITATVENRASIYFDYNLPIITNTVSSSIATYLSLSRANYGNVEIMLYPNPSNNRIILESHLNFKEILIRNSIGQVVSNANCKGTSCIIHLENLPSSTYSLEATTDDNAKHYKTFVVLH